MNSELNFNLLKFSFSDLPNEIIYKIINYLEYKDYVKLLLVNKLFKHIIYSHTNYKEMNELYNYFQEFKNLDIEISNTEKYFKNSQIIENNKINYEYIGDNEYSSNFRWNIVYIFNITDMNIILKTTITNMEFRENSSGFEKIYNKEKIIKKINKLRIELKHLKN